MHKKCYLPYVTQNGLYSLHESNMHVDIFQRLAMDAPVSKGNILDGCILWSEEQIDMLMAEAKKSKDATLTRRKKRTMTNLKNNAYAKWPMPVHFKFDGTQGKQTMINMGVSINSSPLTHHTEFSIKGFKHVHDTVSNITKLHGKSTEHFA